MSDPREKHIYPSRHLPEDPKPVKPAPLDKDAPKPDRTTETDVPRDAKPPVQAKPFTEPVVDPNDKRTAQEQKDDPRKFVGPR